MLPSLGFNEILILGVLALVVIGPKDLPLMLRKLGRWTAKLRGMAQEFRTGFDELARQAELDELKKEVEALRRTTNLNSLANEITKPIMSALPTLEDYAGLSKTSSPLVGEVASAREPEGGRANEGANGADALNPDRPPPPTPSPVSLDSPAAAQPVGGGEDDIRHDEPLARSAP